MTECLILGAPGVGKSTLVAELSSRGRLAYDADDSHAIPDLGGWFDAEGQPVSYKDDFEWRARHCYLWDIPVLKRFIQAQRDPNRALYIAGTATNYAEAVGLFKHGVVLDAKIDTLSQRLASPGRTTPYPIGSSEQHLAWLAERLPGFRETWRCLGLTILNAELNTSELADELIAMVEV